MENTLYMAYRILLYLITTFLAVKFSSRCKNTISRMIILGSSTFLIAFNPVVSSFLFSILIVLLLLFLVLFLFAAVLLLITGYSIAGIIRKILHR